MSEKCPKLVFEGGLDISAIFCSMLGCPNLRKVTDTKNDSKVTFGLPAKVAQKLLKVTQSGETGQKATFELPLSNF